MRRPTPSSVRSSFRFFCISGLFGAAGALLIHCSPSASDGLADDDTANGPTNTTPDSLLDAGFPVGSSIGDGGIVYGPDGEVLWMPDGGDATMSDAAADGGSHSGHGGMDGSVLIDYESIRNNEPKFRKHRTDSQAAIDALGFSSDEFTTAVMGNADNGPGPGGQGQFRVLCQYSHFGNNDPIVFPGKPGAAHLHMFWGNTDANAYTKYNNPSIPGDKNDILEFGGGTCQGFELNRSSYWVPALIDKSTGVERAVVPDAIVLYYKSYRPYEVHPMPQGLEMLSGNVSAGGVPGASFAWNDDLLWSCGNNGFPTNKQGTIPTNCAAGEPINAQIHFPKLPEGRRRRETCSFFNGSPEPHLSRRRAERVPRISPVSHSANQLPALLAQRVGRQRRRREHVATLFGQHHSRRLAPRRLARWLEQEDRAELDRRLLRSERHLQWPAQLLDRPDGSEQTESHPQPSGRLRGEQLPHASDEVARGVRAEVPRGLNDPPSASLGLNVGRFSRTSRNSFQYLAPRLLGVFCAHCLTPMRSRPFLLSIGVTALLAGCSGSADLEGLQTSDFKTDQARDWVAHPAIVRVETAKEIYALSDPHGGYIALSELLRANHLIKAAPPTAADAAQAEWSGGDAVLVVAGDLIDKGKESLGVIDLLRALEAQARESGGRVIVTLGNHEAEFFEDPENDKANASTEDALGINLELKERGIKPRDLARGLDPEGRGAWLHNLPFAAKVGSWFFAHGGNTRGKTLAELDKKLSNSLDHNGWGDRDITGSESILEAQNWYGDPDKDNIGRDFADALGVKHMAFGHNPGAFDARGEMRISKDGSLVKLDVGLGSLSAEDKAAGQLLHVTLGSEEVIETLDAEGKREPLSH